MIEPDKNNIPRRIEGCGLALIQYGPEYAEETFQAIMETKEELSRWMVWCRLDYTFEECKEFAEKRPEAWEAGEGYGFIIKDGKTGEAIGACGLGSVNPVYRFANLGYWVRKSRWGEGIAPNVTRLLAKFAFEHLGLIRVEIMMAVNNQKSIRVAEKVGATFEGTLRNRLIICDGVVSDAYCYSLIPGDQA